MGNGVCTKCGQVHSLTDGFGCPKDESVKVFTCPYCQKPFGYEHHVRAHIGSCPMVPHNRTETPKGHNSDPFVAMGLEAQRGSVYGPKKPCHEAIAHCWRGWIKARYGVDIDLDAEDTAMMMHLMKTCRVGRALHQGVKHPDNWDDGKVYWDFAKEFEDERNL